MSDILKIEPIDNWLKKNNWAIYNHQIETFFIIGSSLFIFLLDLYLCFLDNIILSIFTIVSPFIIKFRINKYLQRLYYQSSF